ncbi:MAG: DUF4962 domain-containing protein, partial [Candidatus Latescibacteria bacterium]|nr:DUF4962 domain-containing protein [Candidatus Latescibacterota bacterium]
ASRQLFGLGIVYDWCYDSLDQGTRVIIRNTLMNRSAAMYANAITGRMADRVKMDIWNPYWEEWPTQYLQNHLWINSCGLAIAGLALFDEVDDASQWFGFTLHKYQRTMTVLGNDGASPEGVGYWAFGTEYMLKFMYGARELLNVNMYDNEWFRNTAKYRQYMMLPLNSWTSRNNVVNLGDSGRHGGHSSVYQLHALAQEYDDGHAQWLAQQLFEKKVGSSSWLDLFWFDPTVKAKSPNDLPTLHHFKDMDIVSARTGWSGNESLVVFKCGPYIGHKALQEFAQDPDGQHVHPDANHFMLFGEGEWLIRDDGYHDKWTDQHNTLLVDGRGQLGEGRPFFNGDELMDVKARPRVINAVSTLQLDHITGDATEAYPRDLGLRRYVRHLLFLKPNVLIVADDIALDEPKDMELLFHQENPISERESDVFLIRGEKSLLRIEPLTLEGVNLSTRNNVVKDLRGDRDNEDIMFTVRLISNRSRWRNAIALSWAKANEEPARIKLNRDGDTWIFTAGNRSVALDWTTGKSEIQR